MMRTCADCGSAYTWKTHHVEVRGFEKKRAEGGANQIVLREETGVVVCDDCIGLRKLKGQGTLV